jgi:hypothetical protein
MTSPVALLVWALSDAWTWLLIGVIALGVVLAVVVFGGGWS